MTLTEVAGPPIAEEISERWIFDRIEKWAAERPDKIAFAVDHADRVEEHRYPDVLHDAGRIAAALQAHGVHRGDRVGIVMENIPQWVFVLLGSMQLGAVAVPLATAWPESALERVAKHAGCKVIFADSPNAYKACNAAAGIGACVVVFNGNEARAVPWDAFLSSGGPAPPPALGRADETAILIYTSGTTGDPKGVQLTTRNLVYELQGVIESLEISDDHRILSVLPFSHILPLIANGLGPLCVGAAVVFLSSISPQRIIDAFHKHRITLFICVPQFFYMLHKRIFEQVQSQPLPMRIAFRSMFRIAGRIASPSFRRKLFSRIHQRIGPDLRLFASGGSRFDARVAEDLSRLGYTVLQAYGLTETAAAATATPARQNVIGTVGKPIRGVSLRIDSPGADGIGEVWIRGPILMKGYYLNEEETRRVMPDGWLRSGDLGYIRPDGNLVITGRSKDVIVLANGKNVYPEEVEAHYAQSPFVKEICVMGAPEAPGSPSGERLHAVIVPDMDEFRRRGQTAISETVRFEIEGLSKQLPSYQRILSYSIRNEPLPRTATRKLKRFEIQRDELEQRRAAAAPQAEADHAVFHEGVGSVVAELVREIKPDASPLDTSTNIELDLGFDSLTRVELLGEAEARLGVSVEETEAASIYTLGELVEALTRARSGEAGRGRKWKEILAAPPAAELENHEVFRRGPITKLAGCLLVKTVRLLALVLFRLRAEGLEKLPRRLPFLICPNHESFLDGPLLASVLPKRVIDNIFILGYSTYWEGPFMSRLGRFLAIVLIDPNVNLLRAMQVGAAGLRKKRVLLVFPEGTRSIDGRVQEFKKGAAILACELGVPVVPVGVQGSFEAWPRAGRFRLHPITFAFGDPIEPSQFMNAADPHAALTDAMRREVRRLAKDFD